MSDYEYNLYPHNIHEEAPSENLALREPSAYDDVIYPVHG